MSQKDDLVSRESWAKAVARQKEIHARLKREIDAGLVAEGRYHMGIDEAHSGADKTVQQVSQQDSSSKDVPQDTRRDERIEYIRSYLKANRAWDRDDSDMTYLVKRCDELERALLWYMRLFGGEWEWDETAGGDIQQNK